MSVTSDIGFKNKNKEEIKKILQDDFNKWKNERTTGETKETTTGETKDDSDIFEILSEAISNFIIAVESFNEGDRFGAEPIKLLDTCTVTRSAVSYMFIFRKHFVSYNKEVSTLPFYVTYNREKYYDNREDKAIRKGWNIDNNYVLYILHNKIALKQYFVRNISNKGDDDNDKSKEADWNKSFIERSFRTNTPEISYDYYTTFLHREYEDDMIKLFKNKSDKYMESVHKKEYKLFYEKVTGLSFYEENKENEKYNSLDELVNAAPIKFWQKPILKKMIEIKLRLGLAYKFIKTIKHTPLKQVYGPLLKKIKEIQGIEPGADNTISKKLNKMLEEGPSMYAKTVYKPKYKGKTFEVTNVEFKLQVDPNHVLGSSIKKTDGKKFRTEYNLCSTLVIHVKNKSSLQEERKYNIDTKKSKKYQENYLKSFERNYNNDKKKIEEWSGYVNGSLINEKYPELAWNSPMWIGKDKYKFIKYTSSFTAGLINLDTATEQRGREWGYERNLKRAQSLPEPLKGLFPVIETCGVVIIHDSTGEILTFPNIKFATLYSTPGGSIDYNDDPPKDMTKQIRMAIENCFRELEEEAGLSKEHFSDLPSDEDIVRLCIEKIYNSVLKEKYNSVRKSLKLNSQKRPEGGETKEEYRVAFRF